MDTKAAAKRKNLHHGDAQQACGKELWRGFHNDETPVGFLVGSNAVFLLTTVTKYAGKRVKSNVFQKICFLLD